MLLASMSEILQRARAYLNFAYQQAGAGVQQAAALSALLPRTSHHPGLSLAIADHAKERITSKYSPVPVRRDINAMKLTRQMPPSVHLSSKSSPKGPIATWCEHEFRVHLRILQGSKRSLWTYQLPPIRAMETHPGHVTKQCVKYRVAFVPDVRPLMLRAFSSIWRDIT